MGIKKNILAGVRWTGVATFAQVLIGFIVFAFVFQKLEPAEFGVFSLAQGVVNVGLAVWSTTLGNAIIAKEKLSNEQLSALFWINISGGILIGTVIFLIAPYLAFFFENTKLKVILYWYALILPTAAIGQTHRFLLQRRLCFDKVATTKMTGLVCFGVVAAVGVYSGAGIVALVGAYLVQTLIESLLMLWMGRTFLIPGLRFSLFESRYFFRFGFFQMMERFVDIIVSQLDTFLLAKLVGVGDLGLYDAVKRVIMRPLNLMGETLEAVMFPVMSKKQHEPSMLAVLFLNNVKFLFTAGFPICLFAILMATPFKELLFGHDWDGAERILQFMAVIMILRLPRIPTDALILAKSKTDWWFYWKIIVLPLMAAAIWLGAKAGLQGVLTEMIALHSLLLILNYFLIVKNLAPVAIGAYWNSFFVIVLLSVPAALMGLMASSIVVANWGKVFAFLTVFACIYGFGMWILQRNLLRVFFEFLNFKSSIMG